MPEWPCKECGAINKIPESWFDHDPRRRPRSSKDSRKFFAVIDAAYYHWGHEEPYPVSADHLRAYLLCEAGWCYVHTKNIVDDADVDMTAEFLSEVARQARGSYTFFDAIGCGYLRAKIAKTINHTIVDQDDFNPIRSAVYEIICLRCNVSNIDELQRNTPSEAISAKNKES